MFLPFDAKLPLPGSQLFEMHAAQRAELRERLCGTLNFIGRLLLPKPLEEPEWQRFTRREIYVMRQSDAHNPDSLLMKRILEHQRECVEFFIQQPELLAGCQRIECMLNDRSANHLTLAQVEHDPAMVHHLSVRRMEQALCLANSIWTARLRFVPSVHLAIAALELRQLLEPENPQVKQLDEIREVLDRCVAKNSDVYFDELISASYMFLPDVYQCGVSFAVHKEGALSIEINGEETNEIDLSRLTKDESCFPDPLLPARLLEQDSGIPSCMYTDQKGRHREIIYDNEKDDYALGE